MGKRKKKFIRFSRWLFRIPSPKPPRRYFSKEIELEVLRLQKYRCASCGRGINDKDNRDADHIRGHDDNSIQNCQMLCLKCHRRKSRLDREKEKFAKSKKY